MQHAAGGARDGAAAAPGALLLPRSARDPARLERSTSLSAGLRAMGALALAAPGHFGGRADDAVADAASGLGEVQLLTLRAFGAAARVHYGGVVTARSVKYLGKVCACNSSYYYK